MLPEDGVCVKVGEKGIKNEKGIAKDRRLLGSNQTLELGGREEINETL